MRSHRPFRYIVSSFAVASAISLLFIPGLGQVLAGLLFVAVIFSAWYGGLGPGVYSTVCILIASLCIYYFAGVPLPAWQIWALVVFTGLGVLISYLLESLHSARTTLEKSERWLSTALRSIGDAVIATDSSGRVLFVNPIAEKLIGWSGAEARGRELVDVFPIFNERTRLPVENPVAKVLAEGRVIGLANHTILRARDGTETPIDDSAAPILDEDGSISGVILVFRDVRERRMAEEFKERLAAIVQSSDDIIASKTLDGIITSWNAGATHILGYTADEVIGKHVSMLMPPGQTEDVAIILGKIRSGEKVEHYETKRRRKDGTIIDVSLGVSPIRNSAGVIIGASKVGRDITRQKTIERERIAADRQKDEFLAMLAHELRNPLATINNAAQVLKAENDADELDWAKEAILRQVKHLARLIDDLLDVSRITQGKIGLRKQVHNLSSLVENAVDAVRPLMDERQHKLEVTLAPEETWLEADSLRVEQILINLLTNAAKYTDSGGQIWLSTSIEDDQAVIKVRDTGIGIAAEFLPNLFDLFFQGDRAIARSEGGLGIGLTLVKQLAEMHGGSASVMSQGPGTGSEFTVRLPVITAPKPQDATRREPRAQHNGSGSRVLVVDDNIDTAKGLAKLLRLQGHEVCFAHDGIEALDVARSKRPKIVLLDIGLPGMDGYSVAKQIRANGDCADSLLIAVSGYGQANDRSRSKDAGFNHHLVKPLDYDALTELMAQSCV